MNAYMKTTLHEYEYANVVYYVDSDRRTVTCKVIGHLDFIELMTDKLLKHLHMPAAEREATRVLLNMPLGKEQLYAVAKCSPDDFFDIEKGKRIAYRKLCRKYQKALLNHMFDTYNLLDVAWSAGAREYATMHDEKMHEIINRSCKRFRNLYIKKEDE